MKTFRFVVLKVIPAIILLAMALPVQAQWSVGLNVGYTHNWLTSSSGYYYNRVYRPDGGDVVGVPVKYSFKDWLAVGGEAIFIQRDYEAHHTGDFSFLQQKVKNNFLTVPLYASFSFGGNRLRGFANVGGYVGYWLSSKVSGVNSPVFNGVLDGVDGEYYTYEFEDDKISFDSRRDNRFEAGALIGAGISYMVSNRIQINAEGRFYYGLTDLQKDYMLDRVPRYNNTISITVGASYRFGK